MMATWRGTLAAARASPVAPSGAGAAAHLPRISFSLVAGSVVDFLDRVVGQLLHFMLEALAFVLADFVLLLVLLELVHPVAADVADGDPRLFGILAAQLGELLAALLGQLGDRQADHLAVDDRVDSEARRCGSPFRPAGRSSGPTPAPTASAPRVPTPSPPGSTACSRHRPRHGPDRARRSRRGPCEGRRDRASAPRPRHACGA